MYVQRFLVVITQPGPMLLITYITLSYYKLVIKFKNQAKVCQKKVLTKYFVLQAINEQCVF